MTLDTAAIAACALGLEFHTEHRGSCCRYVVKDILTDTNARQKLIEVDGKQVTVEAYFKQRYNIELKEPNIPLVETRGPSYFPIELCIVSDSQRVKTDQQTSRMMQEMIRVCLLLLLAVALFSFRPPHFGHPFRSAPFRPSSTVPTWRGCSRLCTFTTAST
jgi:hypothetical protein